jgi:hypothetical protein
LGFGDECPLGVPRLPLGFSGTLKSPTTIVLAFLAAGFLDLVPSAVSVELAELFLDFAIVFFLCFSVLAFSMDSQYFWGHFTQISQGDLWLQGRQILQNTWSSHLGLI